jgi:hypothetical protein
LNKTKRLKFLKITICLGLLTGIAFSRELWFPIQRTFPHAPFLFAVPENFVAAFEWFFSSLLVISLALIIFSRRPKIFLAISIVSLILLSFFDQLHLQPWVYQYLLIFVVFWRHDWQTGDEPAVNETLGLAQILIAGLYVWSGAQKLNFTFAHEILPALVAPAANLFPAIEIPYAFLGIVIPLTETLIGIGLFFRQTRNPAVYSAILMHSFILFLLVAKDYNSIVWIWNFTLIFAVFIAFWQNPISLRDALFRQKLTLLKLIVFGSLLLPSLNFFGYWDSFLSGALYSGSAEIGVIRINDEAFGKLPPQAQSVVFQTKGGAQKMLPLFEWSINETNAPVYPEERVFRQIAAKICQLADDRSQVELIIRERPAVLDGRYKIKIISCLELQ